LQLLILNEEFLVIAVHQTAMITSPKICTVRAAGSADFESLNLILPNYLQH